MVSLLLIRSTADIPFAVESVNEFLAFRRNASLPVREHEILAVCLTRQLDGGWPLRHLGGHEPEQRPAQASPANGRAPSGTGLEVQESYSVSGIWTLCRMDGPLLHTARNPESKRDLILRTLADGLSRRASSTEGGVVFPVFDTGETAESIEAEVRTLRSRYPGLLGPCWYRADKAGGVIPVEPM